MSCCDRVDDENENFASKSFYDLFSFFGIYLFFCCPFAAEKSNYLLENWTKTKIMRCFNKRRTIEHA